MPPRGVKSSSKRARQYEHIKESARKSGRSPARAKQIAAATVNKQRSQSGEAGSSSRTSSGTRSSSRTRTAGRRTSSRSRSTGARKK